MLKNTAFSNDSACATYMCPYNLAIFKFHTPGDERHLSQSSLLQSEGPLLCSASHQGALMCFRIRTIPTQVLQRMWSFSLNSHPELGPSCTIFQTTFPLSKKGIIRNLKSLCPHFTQTSQISALNRTIIRKGFPDWPRVPSRASPLRLLPRFQQTSPKCRLKWNTPWKP